MSELSLTTTRQIKAPVEKVFNAWLAAETLQRFMMPCSGGSLAKVATDPHVGGRFSIVMGEEEIPHAGTYLAIDPHSRIVFTWESPYSVDGSTVTLDFRALDAQHTELTLTHVKFASEGSRDGHTKGWDIILVALAGLTL
ncbi:MAG: SRPBCC domain-containing protein [Alphaproteobacteria bacterium]|jgi:uncharacterized protein YndB with AHSA1/START domain|nr:SRPBCC domain-containing protein [Alphaproteobacteria bacterium]